MLSLVVCWQIVAAFHRFFNVSFFPCSGIALEHPSSVFVNHVT